MILEIKYKNHPVLGNLKLDFTKDGKNPFSKIVLAGENGSGKTQILESLNEFLSLGSFGYFEYVVCEVNGKTLELSKIDKDDASLRFGWHLRKYLEEERAVEIRSSKNSLMNKIEKDTDDIRNYGVSYSSTKINFDTNKVNSTNTVTVDTEKYNNDSTYNFTNIKQLFVNLYFEDAAIYQNWCENNKRLPNNTENESIRKLSRFTKAFNKFFTNLKFKDVDNNGEEYNVNFEKNGACIPIDKLSSGEKQIVFRGASLLKNANVIFGGSVLIDEPEISMHPKWQRKIYDYYCNLFIIEKELKNQIIFATHSNYFLHSALVDEDALIIKLTSKGSCVEPERIESSFTLPNITNSEIDYRIFDIYNPDFHSQLYGHFAELEELVHLPDIDKRISEQPEYNFDIHSKVSYKMNDEASTQYLTLSTYIRNCIHHPENGNMYTPDELKISTDLLVKIIERLYKENKDG